MTYYIKETKANSTYTIASNMSYSEAVYMLKDIRGNYKRDNYKVTPIKSRKFEILGGDFHQYQIFNN